MNEPTTVAADPPKPPEKPPVMITLEQAKRFQSGLERKRCYVFDENTKHYLIDWGMGWAASLDACKWTTPLEARSNYGNALYYPNIKLQLVDQELAELLGKKRCAIEEVLTPPILALLKIAPCNPQARGHVLAQVGKMPPDTLKTFEEVRDWIEENCGEEEALPDPFSGSVLAHVPIRPPTIPQGPNAFQVRCEFAEEQRGTCTYRDQRYGQGSYIFRVEDISLYLNDHPHASVGQLADMLVEEIQEEAFEQVNPSMETGGDGIDYDNHEEDTTNNQEVNVRGGYVALKALLSDYLRTTLTPEQLRQRGL